MRALLLEVALCSTTAPGPRIRSATTPRVKYRSGETGSDIRIVSIVPKGRTDAKLRILGSEFKADSASLPIVLVWAYDDARAHAM